ncbi:MAG: aldo/keto reductase [Planctomycetes bacterium]|nr:aldo/keto reductase [Planctomycetota bacterium]
MLFRPLGNTGLTLSAVGLGGHWRTADGRRYCDSFACDEVPAEVLRHRDAVVGSCLDAGINYLDITTAAECLAYGRVLGGRRDRFVIGADDYQWGPRRPAYLCVAALVANVERCLSRLRTDRLDIWRATSEVHGENSDADVEMVIEAAARLRQAGKICHLGVSGHHPGWMRSTIRRFEPFKVAVLPCVPFGCGESSAAPGPKDPGHPSEDPAHAEGGQGCPPPGEDTWRTAAGRGIGIIGIKPFAGGLLFAGGDADVRSRGGLNDRLAGLALRHALHRKPPATTVVVGLTTPAEARSAVAAAMAPPPDADEMDWLIRTTRRRLGTLPADYRWLAAWDVFQGN